MVDSTKVASISLNLVYFFMVLFAIPLFAPVPVWYVNLEIFSGVVICGFAFIGAAISAVGLLATLKEPLTAEALKTDVPFFNKASILSWCAVGIILTSMFMQEMDHLFALYLILVLATNVCRYMRLKITS